MDGYSYMNAIDYRQTQKLVNDVAKAINGEYSAILCYERIAHMARNEKTRNQILEIRKDEIRHYHEFIGIYTRLTGQKPDVHHTEGCPSTYREALEFALNDEQETVDFYMDIARGTKEHNIKEVFRNAAADEQNHAVWFLYFLTMNK
ncbi:ferritin-like domain-containing protein [Bacillus sp. 1NLA3E]|uniref:ferritin-like domain-containing protein n=1 Tax=Bacillus sp. 1NLA3E TaxID=666686 RepID=UPI0003281067|nr:ferritin-like domain-containing protein [Bacillus sp. 1NLA3E]AGK53808.1 rubrerythrin [Bacillus sp. 1NLA3E]